MNPAVPCSADRKQPSTAADRRTRGPASLVWPVWADTGFTGWKFGHGIRCFSPSLDESVKGLQTKGEKQRLDSVFNPG